MRHALTSEEIQAALSGLPGWRHEGDALQKTFQLKNFREAMSFLVRLSFEAEQRDHHPEIKNVYGKVEILLRTHDAENKVTKIDVELAQAIEAFSWVA
jgi:4a-hydroxytetrahydrobiopterin dehydratase